MLLSGEAGIGKSRLVEVLRERVGRARVTWLTFRCSPYHTHSALYPVLTHLQRLLQFRPEETPAARLDRLEYALQALRLPLAETVPLVATLLSVPWAERYPPLAGSPQQHKQKTYEALLAWLVAETEQQPVLAVWEDLHWADPSTLEWLGLVMDQTPTVPLYHLLTCRPQFTPPWAPRSYLTQLTLARLPHPQVEEMALRVAGGKALPAEVVRQIAAKTDGVPLFVEELTKTVLESGLLREHAEHYTLTGALPPLAIPATLQGALVARLDRLAEGKPVAQLGAVLGRTFTYELLQAVAPLDELGLGRGLRHLVQAEVLYQRGTPPRATYMFKHALVQDAAYQSLLRRTRQQVHQRVAQVVEAQFPEMVAAQPELVGHHYTEAGCSEQALAWWQRAGQHALEHSAFVEAIAHFTTGLALLDTLPDTPERARQELALRVGLGVPLSAIKGPGAPDVFDNYGRARHLCHAIGEAPEHYQVLWGAWRSHLAIAQLETAQELADQLIVLAQRQQDTGLLLEAHHAQWTTLSRLYEPQRCWHHAEQGMALYQPASHHRHVFTISDHDAGVCCRGFGALSLWQLGHLDRALTHSRAAVALARQLAHPTSLAHALTHATWLLQFRRDLDTGLERADEIIAVAAEHGFAQYLATAAILKGWLLARQGQGDAGLALLHQGLGSGQAKGTGPSHAYFLYLAAETHLQVGQARLGLARLAEAFDEMARVGTRAFEPEMHRVHGELLHVLPDGDEAGAEACFHTAIEMARVQNARPLELRAATSLARLSQQQSKGGQAYGLLAPVYRRFTEGFDTADLQEARALLEELGR